MPKSKKSNNFSKRNGFNAKINETNSGKNENECNSSAKINETNSDKNENEYNSSISTIELDKTENPCRKKKQKNKFVKANFDIPIVCKPGTSTIRTNQNSSYSSFTQKASASNPGTSNNANNQNSSVASRSSGPEWKIKEKDIPFPQHVKYGKASHNQSSGCYNELSRGRQCTGNAVVALVMLASPEYEYNLLFKSDHLDSIMAQGNNAYLSVSNGGGRLLELREYDKKIIFVNGDQYLIDMQHSHQKIAKKGTLTKSNGSMFTVPLTEALDVILNFRKLLVMMGEYAIAVVSCHRKFLVFDSHGRVENGSAHDTGTASIWSFNNIISFKKFMYYQCIRYCTEARPLVEIVPVKMTKTSGPSPNTGATNPLMDQYFQNQNKKQMDHNAKRIEKAKIDMASNQSKKIVNHLKNLKQLQKN